MPVTPYHFGAGTAFKALLPKHFSLSAFVLAQLIIDLEPLYYLVQRQYPWHRFMHTFAGASLVVLLTIVFAKLFRVAVQQFLRWLDSPRVKLPPVSRLAIAVGAMTGAYSHIALDSIMHEDVFPLAPFSQASPWLGVIRVDDLERDLIVAGTMGLVGWAFRFRKELWS